VNVQRRERCRVGEVRVRGSGFRVQGLGFRVQGVGLRVQTDKRDCPAPEIH